MNSRLIEKFASVLSGTHAPVVCDPGQLMDASGPVKAYQATATEALPHVMAYPTAVADLSFAAVAGDELLLTTVPKARWNDLSIS